jgi:hypothetical protein
MSQHLRFVPERSFCIRRCGDAIAHGDRITSRRARRHCIGRVSCFLAFLDAIGAGAGGANILSGTARVTFWGALAMALNAGIGKVFGMVV